MIIIKSLNIIGTYRIQDLENNDEVKSLLLIPVKDHYSFRGYKDTNICGWFEQIGNSFKLISELVEIKFATPKHAKGSTYKKEKREFCIKYNNDLKMLFVEIPLKYGHPTAKSWIDMMREQIGFSPRTTNQDIWCNMKKFYSQNFIQS